MEDIKAMFQTTNQKRMNPPLFGSILESLVQWDHMQCIVYDHSDLGKDHQKNPTIKFYSCRNLSASTAWLLGGQMRINARQSSQWDGICAISGYITYTNDA
jgi:hypothetical protein